MTPLQQWQGLHPAVGSLTDLLFGHSYGKCATYLPKYQLITASPGCTHLLEAQAATVPRWMFLFFSKLQALFHATVYQVQVQQLGQQPATKPGKSHILRLCSKHNTALLPEEHGLCWAFLITNTRWFRRPDINNWTDLPANVLLQVNPLSSKCWSTVCLRFITLTSIQALQISFFWKPNCFTQVNRLHSAKTVSWMGCSKMKYKKFVLSKRIWKNAFSCFRSTGIKFHCLNFTTATQEGASRKL